MLRLILSLALAVAVVESFLLPPRELVRRSTFLLASTTDASSDANELVLAARHGDVTSVSKALAENPGLLNARVSCAKPPQMDQSTALIWASRLGFVAVVDALLGSGRAEVDAATTAGWTALFVAAQNGEEECVESLLAAGADLATALALGDEFTNVKLARMAGPARMQLAQAPPAPSPPPQAAASSNSFMESESALWRATAARAPSASAASDLPAGLSELEELRLKLKWSAPPSDDEETAALAARCTVYKLRYARLQELEGEASPAPRAAATTANARASPPAPASSQGSGGDRLAVLEAKIDQLLAESKANYAAGFKDGFAAAQDVKSSPSQKKGSEFGGALF
jgi:hypothetical protein